MTAPIEVAKNCWTCGNNASSIECGITCAKSDTNKHPAVRMWEIETGKQGDDFIYVLMWYVCADWEPGEMWGDLNE